MNYDREAESASPKGHDLTTSPNLVQNNQDSTAAGMTDKTCHVAPFPDPASDQPIAVHVPLKFVNTKRKRVPIDYLGLHTVLDRLGTSEHPETWGKLLAWHLMPFRIRRDGREIFQPYVARRDGKQTLIEEPITHSYSEEELRKCTVLYEGVVSKLSHALQRGELVAHAVSPSGSITQITEQGVWATQQTRIFYTGIISRGLKGDKIQCRVIIKAADFSRWQAFPTNAKQGKVRNKTLHLVQESLDNCARQGGYKLLREPVLQLMKEVFGEGLSEHRFDEELWKKVKEKRSHGRPQGEEKTAFEADVPALKAKIARIKASSTPGKST